MAKLLSGSDLAEFIKARQLTQARNLRQTYRIIPKLAIVTTSKNPVIATYMRLKQAYGNDIGVEVEVFSVQSSEVIETLAHLNDNESFQSIIVQLPLDDAAATDEVLGQINPAKDVDGLNPAGTHFDAATPQAINWLLAGYNVDLQHKKVAIVGRGRLVGAPLEKMWRQSGVNVDVYEKGDSIDSLRDADIIVTATGIPRLITSRHVSLGATVIDAGTASESGKIVGDVDDDVRLRPDVSITPKIGGVGPLTVASLFENALLAARRIAEREGPKDGSTTQNR